MKNVTRTQLSQIIRQKGGEKEIILPDVSRETAESVAKNFMEEYEIEEMYITFSMPAQTFFNNADITDRQTKEVYAITANKKKSNS